MISFGNIVMFEKYVKTSSLSKDSASHKNDINMAGLHGAIGSTDANHIALENVFP